MYWIIAIIIGLLLIALFSKSDETQPELKQDYDDTFGETTDTFSTFNDGIWIGSGKIDRDLAFRHCLICAGSGMGKTSTILINTSLELTNCSAVFLDPAEELFTKTAGALSKKGFDIKILNFTDPSKSIGFNPLLTAKTSTELNQLAETIFAQSLKQTKDSFWPMMASRFVVMIFKLQKKLPESEQTLANTLYLINSLQGDPRKVDTLFAKYADERLFEEYKAMVKHEGKLISSILATIQSTLGIFGDENVARVTSTNTIQFSDFRNTPTALYLHMPVMDAKYLSFLAEIFFTQFFRFCMSHTIIEDELDIFVIADEAGSFTIKGFPEALANLRKYFVSVTFAIQSKSQLIERYGKEDAETILANSYHKVIFPGMETSMAKELETRMGKWSFEREDGKKGQREVMTVSELIHLSEGSAVYVAGPKRPSIITLHPYYENARLLRKSEIEPPEIIGGVPDQITYTKLPELKVVPKEKVA